MLASKLKCNSWQRRGHCFGQLAGAILRQLLSAARLGCVAANSKPSAVPKIAPRR
jgi:hypothetical protein